MIFFLLSTFVFCRSLELASLQMNPQSLTPSQRFEKSVSFIEKINSTVDIVVLPADWTERRYINGYWDLAKSRKIAICYSYVEEKENSHFVEVVDMTGSVVLSYVKHGNLSISPSLEYNHTVLVTRNEKVSISVLFSVDLYFPESTRVLMLKGVELVLVSGAEEKSHRETYYDQILNRAHENVLDVVTASPAIQGARSLFVDWALASVKVLPEGKEDVLTATVDIPTLRHYRLTGAYDGDAFRRPYSYRSLCYKDFIPEKLEAKGENLKLKIGLLQMMPSNTIEKNMEIAEDFIKRASEKGVDIVIVPEMFSVGYSNMVPTPITDYGLFKWSHDFALQDSSTFVSHFQTLAKHLDVAIGITFLRAYGEHPPKNSIALIDRHGEILYIYDKVHTCTWILEANNSPGRSFHAAVLNTKEGDVIVGSLICFDRDQPESARLLTQKGVELILATNGCDMNGTNIIQLGVRAHENAVAIALANYPAPLFDGNSVIINHVGETILNAGEKEGVYIGEVDVGKLREYRKSGTGKILSDIHLHTELCTLKRNENFARRNFYDRVAGSTT